MTKSYLSLSVEQNQTNTPVVEVSQKKFFFIGFFILPIGWNGVCLDNVYLLSMKAPILNFIDRKGLSKENWVSIGFGVVLSRS